MDSNEWDQYYIGDARRGDERLVWGRTQGDNEFTIKGPESGDCDRVWFMYLNRDPYLGRWMSLKKAKAEADRYLAAYSRLDM